MALCVLFGTFVLLLIIGTPIAFCLGVASFATIIVLGLPPVVVFQRLNSGVSVFSLMAIPFFLLAGEWFTGTHNPIAKLLGEVATAIARALNEGAFWYMALYALMILFFSYFWVATQFNELQIADDLKKNGGYIPGVRPGQATSEYLHNAMSRITLAGAVFLTVIAIIPILLSRAMNPPIPYAVSTFFGGTSMLILVGVLLDTMRQMETHLLMRHYDGFLKKGKLRGRFG